MLSRTDETELLEPLHAGVHEAPLWGTFLMRLRQRTRADAVVLVAGDTVLASGTDMESLRDRAGLPPLPSPRLGALRPGRIYAGEELYDAVRAAARRGAPAFARIMRVAGNATQGWLAILREGRDFAAGEAAVIAGLSTHLAIALDTRQRLDHAGENAVLGAQALARAGVGWLAFDGEARLVAASDGAPATLAAAGVIAVPERRLIGLSATAEARLIAACAQPMEGSVIRLGDRTDLLVTPPPRDGGRHAMVALLRHAPASTGRTTALMALYGLTHTEAGLAEAIASGASLDAAGAACGLTRESARTYSKRVFAKTGARGQPDLVRLVLTGVAGLA
jgi:DNA-binding CsgD family transcriptional regulator